MSRRDDDGAGDGGSEARRMIEGREHGGGVMGSTTGGRRSERELSSGQREGEGYRTAPSLRCSTGPLTRVGHVLDERDAAPTGLELLGRGRLRPLFLSPNSPIL